MDALADFFPHLLVFAALLLAAIALTPAVESVGLPGPAAFLAVGVIAGYLELIPTDRLGELPLASKTHRELPAGEPAWAH